MILPADESDNSEWPRIQLSVESQSLYNPEGMIANGQDRDLSFEMLCSLNVAM